MITLSVIQDLRTMQATMFASSRRQKQENNNKKKKTKKFKEIKT